MPQHDKSERFRFSDFDCDRAGGNAFFRGSAPPKDCPPKTDMLARAGLGKTALKFSAIDLETRQVVAEHDSERMLPPASMLKIVTALYALDRLGLDHRFAIRVLHRGAGAAEGQHDVGQACKTASA